MKKIAITSLLMTTLLTSIQAQDFKFDEMSYSPEQTVFKLFAPNNAKCTVKVGKKKVKMTKAGDCLWTATVKGDLKGQPYVFNTGHGDTPGVFAKAVGTNGKEAYILDLATTNPVGWESDQRPVVKSPVDLIVYEMHHRDFSIARPDAKYPGKFLALTEPWAIKHLKDLGINAVHILPSYDYGSVDESRLNEPQYNWGYDPVNYNVPEGGYSTDPSKPEVRIREFKQMVQALHKAGIRVILDVVYNHTYNIDNSNFQKTYPDYYYRKTADGAYSNGSGCGNETASEKPMMRRFMMESVKYWINEYHIDGFRFDLMGCHDIETMNQIRQMVNTIDPTIFIYGEGWSAGACALPNEKLGMKANIPQMHGIAAFSDEIRDALRGPFSDDTVSGWLGRLNTSKAGQFTGDQEVESLKFGLVGCIQHPQVDMKKVNYSKEPWAIEPTQMMSYVSCHDDMCLVDRLKASIPRIKEDELIRLDLLAQTAVFTSQGVPFMLSGEELLRDKKGVHNSFNSPDSINALDWGNLQRYPGVTDYYRRLIALRRHHPAFRLGSAAAVREHLEFLPSQPALVAFHLKGLDGIDSWSNIYVIFNGNRETRTITLPEGTYRVVCQNGQIDETGLTILPGGDVKVSGQSAMIMVK